MSAVHLDRTVCGTPMACFSGAVKRHIIVFEPVLAVVRLAESRHRLSLGPVFASYEHDAKNR